MKISIHPSLKVTIGLLAMGGIFVGQGSPTGGSADPEGASGWREVPTLEAREYMVVAANPFAAEAGRKVLAAGGSAIDAAVAVQAALNVVEPQSSGFGGGAFFLHYDKDTGAVTAYDGREEAPQAVTPDLFMEGGSPMYFWDGVIGGRAVGTPGVAKALGLAQAEHGLLPWSALFDEAIHLAEDGFPVSPRLNALLSYDPFLRLMAGSSDLFYDSERRPHPVGYILKQPALAHTLTTLAAEGPDALYQGPIAGEILRAVASAHSPRKATTLIAYGLGYLNLTVPSVALGFKPAPGLLTQADLSAYEAKKRAPICLDYRQYRVCGAPPPTSGGVTTLEILGILSHFDIPSMDPRSPAFFHLLAEAEALAFADRGLYIADPQAMAIAPEALLGPAYLKGRAALIDPERSDGPKAAGVPSSFQGSLAPDESPELPCTSHFVIVDSWGDVVSMTTSIENVFGSRVMAAGLLLNNQLTDFSFVPERDGKAIANAVGPGKRPRSSMAPLMIFDKKTGAFVAALGSPGGSQIIGYVAQSAIALMDFGLSPQEAAELPHVLNRNGATEVEAAGWGEGERGGVESALEGLGHTIKVKDLTSGLHILRWDGARYLSGADPRREGAPAGK